MSVILGIAAAVTGVFIIASLLAFGWLVALEDEEDTWDL